MRGLWGRTCLLFVTSGEPRGFRPFLLLLLPLDAAAHLARSELKGIGVALSRTWIPKAESVYSEAPVYLSARSALPPQIWNAFRFQGPGSSVVGDPRAFRCFGFGLGGLPGNPKLLPPMAVSAKESSLRFLIPKSLISIHVSALSLLKGGSTLFRGVRSGPSGY